MICRRVSMKTTAKTDWEARDLWTDTHRCFAICDSATVDIEFADEVQSAEIAALRDYWQTRSSDVLERWEVFKAVMGANVSAAWWKAFYATRDNPAPAASELGQAAPEDPFVESAGNESTTDTSDLSKAS